MSQNSIAQQPYTKDVKTVNISSFTAQCTIPSEVQLPSLPEKLALENKHTQTAKNDPYTKRANITVVIDNTPKNDCMNKE
ncbi:hypothetical protein A1D23_11795 [Chelonobacter oris]|nr:hypothetical protein [Chelonobacter oris]